MIKVIAENYVKKENVKEFIELCKCLKHSTLEEDGCYDYDFYQDEKDEGHITFVEEWKTNKSLSEHSESKHLLDFIDKTKDMLTKKGEVHVYNQVFSDKFYEYKPEKAKLNAHLVHNRPFLIVSKKGDKVNAMTASWGLIGNIWNQPTFLSVIRETRFTKELVDSSDFCSFCFLDGFNKELGYLGTVSGRDEDKLAKMNLHIDYIDGVPYIKESNDVFIVEKSFNIDMTKDNFINQQIITDWYTKGIDLDNYHTIYLSKIVKHLGR